MSVVHAWLRPARPARRVALAGGVAAALVASLLVAVPAHAAPKPADGKAAVAPDKSTPVSKVPVKASKKPDSAGAEMKALPPVVWPSAGSADSTASVGAVSPGGLPVRVLADGSADAAPRTRAETSGSGGTAAVPVRVTVAGPQAAAAAGVNGVLLQVSRADGQASRVKVGLSVSYAKFATAYGADYGSRLRLVSLPDCALTTPSQRGCQVQTPLVSVNNAATQTVSTQTLAVGGGGGTIVALATASDGTSSEGNWKATDLSLAYSWASGTAGGEFSLNYPIKAPASLGGPAPQLAFGYSSGSVDAKTGDKNGQSSVVGEGWDLSDGGGYVERSFRSCADDGGTTADLCWVNAEAMTLVFGGRSVKLIKNGTGWSATSDDKLRIENIYDNTAAANYVLNGEYWKVTTQDGTKYFFGKVHRYIGDTTNGTLGTSSVLTEPVVGNNAGEPCYGSPDHVCFQPYRWNLDYVVDPRGNSMTYFYDKFVGSYGFNNNQRVLPTDLSARLNHIEYGTRTGSEATTTAPMQVVFDYADRCWTGDCSWPPPAPPTHSGFADTPTDLWCDANAATCSKATAPMHFTRYRLSDVKTQIRDSSTYRTVDKWDLEQTFLTNGDTNGDGYDDTSPNLALIGLTHTGYAADGVTTLAEPKVVFGYTKLANRSDWRPGVTFAPFYHYRISQVDNGVGGQTFVTYLPSDCDPAELKINADSNPFRCFPQYFKPPTADAGWGYFNKYVVDKVTERDLTGGGQEQSPDEVTSYAYSTEGSNDTALWAHDDVDLADVTKTSWGDWRGYPTVTVTHGAVAGQQTVTKTVYHRGLSGDAKKSGDDTQVLFNQRSGFTLEALQPGSSIPVGLAGGGTVGTGSQCLDILYGNTADGTALQSAGCTGNNVWQQWIRSHDNTQRPTLQNPASGKCVDVQSSGTANGSHVWLYTCNNGAAQVWYRQPNGSYKNPNSGKCLDVSGHSLQPGGLMQIWDCNGLWSQVFMPTANKELVRSQAVRCATASGAGGPVQDQGCGSVDNNTNQIWQLQPNGSVVNPATGMCLDVQSSGTANNTIVQLWTCNQGPAQQWVAQTDGTLKNPNSGRCLDGEGDGGLFIYDCTARLSQKWVGRTQDHSALNGEVRASYALNNGAVGNYTVHRYLATFTISRGAYTTPGASIYSFMARENQTKSATWIAGSSSWRWTQIDTTYDNYGLPTDVNNWRDVAGGTDDVCTHTDYARNMTNYLIGFPSQTVTTDCAASPTGSNFLQGTQTLYDGSTTVGAAPTQGLSTQTNALTNAVGTTLTWTKQSRTTYDANGRLQDRFDALEHKTMTRYTPATGGPVTAATVTNALGHVTATTVEPGHGTTTSVLDANNHTTTIQYDPLGRRMKVWLPGRATNLTGNSEYSYTVSNSAPNVVTSKQLGPNGNQIISTSLYDGRLRLRQSQSPAAQAKGGRIVTDTAYDARGLQWQQTTFWDGANGPGTALAGFTDAAVNQQTRTTFDNLQRPIVNALYATNVLKWQTTTTYDGDSTTVVPPAGGIPTRQMFDAAGHVTALRQYTAGTTAGAYQDTTYQYDRLGHQTKIADPAGNQWTTTYDRLGRVTGSTDPDAGSSSQTYDAAGRVTSSTDGRNFTLAYAYDDLDRKTGVYEGTTSGTQRIGWVYDTVRKGAVTSSTRYAGSVAYTTTFDNYNVQGQALSTTTVLPPAANAPTGTYTVSATYNVDGSTATTTYPAAGGLPQETVTKTYDSTGQLLSMAGLDTYIADTSYYGFGPVYQQVLGSGTKQVRSTATVEESTGRLTASSTETQNQTTSTSWDLQLGLAYGFDNAGNITSVKETGSGTSTTECFKYDGLRELAEAWTTAAAACQANPSQAVVAGADPYWSSYQYQTTNGNRTGEVRHASTGDTTRTYTYPASGATSVRPHTVTGISSTGAATGTDGYTYDNAGNTWTRAIAGGPNQTLTWDTEGRVATIADGGTTTAYTYAADGGRLLSVNSASATAYLPGGFEVKLQGGSTAATRYYGDVAVRSTSGGLSLLAGDHHGTGTLAINAATLTPTRRRLDPFGNPRATAAISWPSTRGFVGGTKDDTGLTHLGAREYDPAIGRFISDDSVTNGQDPLQINGYSYANNSPLRLSDPSGTEPRPWHNPNYDPNTCADHKGGYECHPADDPINTGAPYAPPNCHNSGRTIKCDLTDEEQRLKDKADQMVADMQDECFLICIIGETRLHNRKSPYEIAWCTTVDPLTCWYASHAAQDMAKAAANDEYKDCKDGKCKDDRTARKWNAFHHAYWFALLGETGMSHDDAIMLGVAHELGAYQDRINDNNHDGPNVDYGQRDSRADMYNNAAGFDIGRNRATDRSGSFEDAIKADIESAIESNQLATYGD